MSCYVHLPLRNRFWKVGSTQKIFSAKAKLTPEGGREEWKVISILQLLYILQNYWCQDKERLRIKTKEEEKLHAIHDPVLVPGLL